MIADIVFSRAAAAVLAAVPAVLRLAITSERTMAESNHNNIAVVICNSVFIIQIITMTVAVISASTITVIVVFVVIADTFISPSLKATTTKQNLIKLAALAVLAKLK